MNENFQTFRRNFFLEFDGTQKLNSQSAVALERNVHLALEKLKEEVFSKFSALESQEERQ